MGYVVHGWENVSDIPRGVTVHFDPTVDYPGLAYPQDNVVPVATGQVWPRTDVPTR